MIILFLRSLTFIFKLFTSLNKLMIGTHVRSSLSFNLGLIIIIETLSQLYAVADRYFVNSVETGGIAALNYAQTLFILPITTISLALSTALFPNLSKSYSSDDRGELEKKFYSGIRINILIFIPIMLVFIFFGNEIIAIIYERGKFGSSDTIMTAEALKYFSISIVFYSIYSVFNKIFYSAKWIKMLLVITICGIFFKILLNFILVKSLAQNGLALSSSISYTLFFLLSLLIIQKKLSFKIVKNLFLEIVFHLICAALSYLIIILLVGNVSGSMVITFSSILLFVFIYVLNLWILKSHSISIISNLLYSRGLLK